jgi:cellulose synthase/poly-beta-1,6-N-acetylglucosamine synthase-like glycosyltransferase
LLPDARAQFGPTCTVVVCTRNRPEELNRCLEAVRGLIYPRFEVLVVDNAPADARTREVADRWGARYTVEPALGLSRARNRGARECATDIVAYLDDDSVPEPEWLGAVVREFADPQVMAVTGQILPLRVETEAERFFGLLGGFDTGGQGRRVLDRGCAGWFEVASFGGVGNGGNMAFRRSAFDLWPGFDERLGAGTWLPGGDEHYAFFALIDRGYRVVYTPLAVVRHAYPRTLPELQTRYLRGLSGATGYMTFLFFEEARYRWATLKYAVEAVRGVRRPWRPPPRGPRPRIAPAWRQLLAALSGPLLYVRTRLRCAPAGEHPRAPRQQAGLRGDG